MRADPHFHSIYTFKYASGSVARDNVSHVITLRGLSQARAYNQVGHDFGYPETSVFFERHWPGTSEEETAEDQGGNSASFAATPSRPASFTDSIAYAPLRSIDSGPEL